MGQASYVRSDIDFDRNGKQISFLHLPYSPHTDAWGTIPLPIAVIKNGSGPTILFSGGVHGDEYEGPITLGRLLRNLDPAQVQGRLIFLSAANLPAVRAGRRVSPEDGLNMNRTFPGDPNGSPTQQISHYMDSVLFPLCDAFVDLHSGGSSLDLIPAAMMQVNEDEALAGRIKDAIVAFNAPLTVRFDTYGESRTTTAAALKHGLVVVGTEMGSAGAVSRQGLDICRNGVQNLLHHFQVVEKPRDAPPPGPPTRITTVVPPDGFSYANAHGIFESFHDLGATVSAGQEAGCIHFLDDPGREPELIRFKRSGMLFCRRAPGLSIRGNCVSILVEDWVG